MQVTKLRRQYDPIAIEDQRPSPFARYEQVREAARPAADPVNMRLLMVIFIAMVLLVCMVALCVLWFYYPGMVVGIACTVFFMLIIHRLLILAGLI
jgi:hypothetical protein